MAKAVVEDLGHVFRYGLKWSTGEVLLLGLCQHGEYTDNPFGASQLVAMESVTGAWTPSMEAGDSKVGQCACKIELGMRRVRGGYPG